MNGHFFNVKTKNLTTYWISFNLKTLSIYKRYIFYYNTTSNITGYNCSTNNTQCLM